MDRASSRAVRGEADLVVDDDVHRAADVVAPGLGHLEGLHHHALASERRIAVDDDRYDEIALSSRDAGPVVHVRIRSQPDPRSPGGRD